MIPISAGRYLLMAPAAEYVLRVCEFEELGQAFDLLHRAELLYRAEADAARVGAQPVDMVPRGARPEEGDGGAR